MDISALQWAMLIICSVLIGFSKTGVPTLGIFVVALMANVFPARESVGILTPILITGDIIAIIYYRKAVVWRYIIVLLPWVLLGILLGFGLLDLIDNETLSVLIGSLVLLLIILFLSQNRVEKVMNFSFAKSRTMNGSLGVLAGFTTMIGNAAGSIMSLYLLSKGMQKTAFVGTNAFFFFIVNMIKVPFTVNLGLITPQSLVLNAWMVPVVAVGAFIGFKVLPLIPKKLFQTIILMCAVVGAIFLILH
ncbi:sulfite exporter TauE/SafE family protein [Paenibacillus abyssi]|uniref:Probable membrane transporter protein n=1 Tax=Paenibacillus abyssi TaxID=1340531 RepID=A0A917CZZ3_9BACL|nr:sulfite exporter TauE/SafE family protein [Paenibacillus abyssi]GGG01555.1 anion permease [Paenibacillus abyssi]